MTEKSQTAFICTLAHPWRQGDPAPLVLHPSACEIADRDGYPGGDIVTMRCDICGYQWEMELPQ